MDAPYERETETERPYLEKTERERVIPCTCSACGGQKMVGDVGKHSGQAGLITVRDQKAVVFWVLPSSLDACLPVLQSVTLSSYSCQAVLSL